MYAVRLLGSPSYQSNQKFFEDRGIDTRPMFYSFKNHKHLDFLHTMAGRTHANAMRLHNEIVMLPSSPELMMSEIDKICEAVIERANSL